MNTDMDTLLVDVGNSRLKWAVLRAGKLGPQQALEHGGAAHCGHALRRMFNWCKARAPPPRAVLVVSVAGADFDARLRRNCRAQLGLVPRFVRSRRAAGGVMNGYRQVWRLGADRWVALLGARALSPARAVCVADVGTALTLDLLDDGGRHRGGAIAPGPELMIAALLRDTGGIRRRARAPLARREVPLGRLRSGLFARDTRGGLSAGARHATAALIERARGEARAHLGRMPLLFVTGGGAAALRGLLRSPHRVVADLVLRGLAVLAMR